MDNRIVDYIEVGKRLRATRRELELTQDHLARRCDISTSFLGHIERGTRICSLDTLASLALCLNTSLDFLVFGDYRDTRHIKNLSYEDLHDLLAYTANEMKMRYLLERRT